MYDDGNKRTDDIELSEKTYNENIELMRFGLLAALINNSQGINNFDEKTLTRALDLKGDTHMIFTVKLDKKSIELSKKLPDDINPISFSIMNTSKYIVEKYVSAEIFIYDENIVAIISDTQENIDLHWYTLINELQQTVLEHYNIITTIGVGNTFRGLKNAPESYQNSKSALHYAFSGSGNRIVRMDDFPPQNTVTFFYDEPKELKLQSIIKMGDTQALNMFINEIFKEMSNKKATLLDCRICILEMFSLLLKLTKTIIPCFETSLFNDLDFVNEMYKKESLDEIKQWFLCVCGKMTDYMGLSRQSASAVLANKCYDYLKCNYTDPTVSLKSVSEFLFISPSYLSTIFKKETGETFRDCLIRIRMEKAMELLHTSFLKISEISAKIGYTDPHYLSYRFKEYYGQSPNESRSKGL